MFSYISTTASDYIALKDVSDAQIFDRIIETTATRNTNRLSLDRILGLSTDTIEKTTQKLAQIDRYAETHHTTVDRPTFSTIIAAIEMCHRQLNELTIQRYSGLHAAIVDGLVTGGESIDIIPVPKLVYSELIEGGLDVIRVAQAQAIEANFRAQSVYTARLRLSIATEDDLYQLRLHVDRTDTLAEIIGLLVIHVLVLNADNAPKATLDRAIKLFDNFYQHANLAIVKDYYFAARTILS